MKAKFNTEIFKIQGENNSNTQQINLTIIQSTCLSNQNNNTNNAIQSSNLVFVSGAFLVMQNIFQNIKTFIHRINSTPSIGMALHQASDSFIVIATKKIIEDQNLIQNFIGNKEFKPTTQLCLQLYSHFSKQAISCKLQGIDQFIDMHFLDRKRLLMLVKHNNTNYLSIVNIGEKNQNVKSVKINTQPKKILVSERKTYILTTNGILQYDQYCDQNIDNLLFYKNIGRPIIDYKTVDNQLDILLHEDRISTFIERQPQDNMLFKNIFLNQEQRQIQKQKGKCQVQIPSCFVRIGRNLLVAYSTCICISHFIIDDRKIRFVNNFEYKNKAKGGILSIQQSFDEMHLAMTVLVGGPRQKKKIQNFMFNLSILSTDKKFINPYMRMCPMGLQNGQITSFQNAITSDTYYLSGQNIINYNYLESIQKKGKYSLHQNPKYLAVHPLNYQFLCIFQSLIKFYNKVQQEFIQIWSQQIICTSAKYSTNGLLALAYCQDSFYQVQIYDPYTFTKIRNISQIYWKSPILKIQWCHFATCVAVYSHNEFALYKINGQKVLQYKETMICSNPPVFNQNICLMNNNYSYYQLNYLFSNSLRNTHLGAISASLNGIYNGTQNSLLQSTTNKQQNTINLNSMTAMEYDQQKQALLFTTLNKQFYYCRKQEQPTGQDLLWQMQNVKYCQISQIVTCIKICANLNTVFFGTIDGHLLWTQYPFHVLPQPGTTLSLHKLQFHSQPITNIALSNSFKYLYLSVSQGLFVTKIKKLAKYDNVYVMFDDLQVSNLNFVQMSSGHCLYQGRQKLKVLLQKRKTSFNQLEQLKKQWDAKRNQVIKKLETDCQRQQLNQIDSTLVQLDQYRKIKKELQQKIQKVQEQKKNYFSNAQRKLDQQLLRVYQQNDKLRKQRKDTKQKCLKQYQNIKSRCSENIKQIQIQLKNKYENFLNNYERMKQNITNHQHRLDIQKIEQKEEAQLLIDKKINELREKDINLQQELNNLRATTARAKKQMDRFIQRRDFLLSKKRFFDEQLKYCVDQKVQLQDIKKKLEEQLSQSQALTHKKQKRLKKYYKQSSMLSKFRSIHQHMKSTSTRQVQFLQEQSKKILNSIIQIQKQLSQVAQLNQNSDKKINSVSHQIAILKQSKKNRQSRFRYIYLLHNQIVLALQKLQNQNKQQNTQNKVKEMNNIYQQYYIDKKLESLINLCSEKQEENQDAKNFMDSFEKRNNKKIHQNLIAHKKYLEENLHLFEQNSIKNIQQMKLRYLKYQAQNYNLIAQCNIRKQQTSKKKRILHQLIDSVKETQLYLNQLHKENIDSHISIKTNKAFSIKKDTSFQRNNQRSQSRKNLILAKQRQGFSEYSTSIKPESAHHKKRLLQIQKFNQKDNKQPKSKAIRRIKTAIAKKKSLANQIIHQDDQNVIQKIQGQGQFIKPKTAQSKKRVKISIPRNSQNITSAGSQWDLNSNLFIRDKSGSKPTTCTYSSKIKFSIAN